MDRQARTEQEKRGRYMKFEIKNRWTGAVIFKTKTQSFRMAVEAAVKAEADLSGADLSEADLSEADMSKANLWKADLWKANLAKANLWKANLWKANLAKANLSEANLSEANLWKADLSEADMSEANLSWTKICDANMHLAIVSYRGLKVKVRFEILKRGTNAEKT